MSDQASSLTTLSNLFKVKYDKKSYAAFNKANPLFQALDKQYNFKGKSLAIDAVLGFTGSVGSGSLPETNVYQQENAALTRKKMYARILLDREAMIASKGDEHAFESVTKRQVKKGVESWNRNLERALFAYENGKLFEGDNSTVVTGAGTSGAPYVVVALASTWVRWFVELKDYVNVGTETTQLEITAVNASTRAVSLVGTSATLAAVSSTGGSSSATTAKVYMQKSKDNDIDSILRICKATSSTLYGISVGVGWQSYQKDADAAGITTDLINELVTGVELQSGDSPTLLVTSFKQYRKVQDLLGDKLRYMTVGNRDPVFKKAGFNFKAIEWNTQAGGIPMIASRMCPDDHFFALNMDNITLFMAEQPKWADEDGNVLLRSATADAYEARYIGYGEIFVHPNAQGVLYDLA
jgi:hypothetical protein